MNLQLINNLDNLFLKRFNIFYEEKYLNHLLEYLKILRGCF